MCGYDILSWLKPDIAAHISGGPIPMSDDDLDKVIDTTSFAVEICSSGNYGSTKRAVERMRAKGQLARLTLGTDTPGGTGVIPRGMFRNICYIASVCGVPPAEAVAIATGNTAKAHGLDVGILAPGRPADLIAEALAGREHQAGLELDRLKVGSRHRIQRRSVGLPCRYEPVAGSW